MAEKPNLLLPPFPKPGRNYAYRTNAAQKQRFKRSFSINLLHLYGKNRAKTLVYSTLRGQVRNLGQGRKKWKKLRLKAFLNYVQMSREFWERLGGRLGF